MFQSHVEQVAQAGSFDDIKRAISGFCLQDQQQILQAASEVVSAEASRLQSEGASSLAMWSLSKLSVIEEMANAARMHMQGVVYPSLLEEAVC